ncbi:MAG: PAS domain-containing protein [Candidatus Peribacteraceae bacterium]|nr:PAS domain-containing protein [Candidatus Peribacteraceae bacterium]
MSLPRRLVPLRKIFDEIGVHVVVTNPDGNIIYANGAAENHTGYMFSEMKGKTPGELWGGKMPSEFYREMWRVIEEQKRAYTEQMRNCRKNGDPYWQEVHILPVLNGGDAVECYLGIEFDRENAAQQKSFAALSQRNEFRTLKVRWPREWREEGSGK